MLAERQPAVDRSEEVAAKLETLRAWLDHNDLDAVLLSSWGGFAWVTGGGDNSVTVSDEAGAASVLVTGQDAYLLSADLEARRLVEEQVAGVGLTAVDWPWADEEGESRTVDRLCDPARTVSDLGRLGLPAAPPDLAGLRFTLLAPEIERYRRLGVDVAEALEVACLMCRSGDKELDVAARLEHECRRRGVTAVVNLVGGDERIARYRHPVPSEQRVDRCLLVAVTGRRHGLHASATRMVHWGAPDLDLSGRYRAVLRVDARLIAESRPAARLGDVFTAGLDQYGREGFGDEWRLHHQGGLTGYAGRELFASARSHHRLRADQAVAWNPSITRVKSEDTVLVTEAGPEVLTRTRSWPQVEVEVERDGDSGDRQAVARPALLVRD